VPTNLLIFPLWISVPVLGYIGPGIGVGTIAVVLGFIASIVLAAFALVWYPVKRLFKRQEKKPLTETSCES
jgi:hypothetical protein